MANGQWELFPHEADMGVRGSGNSKEEAFEQAAVALTAVISDPETVEAKEMVEITCEAPDDELLLVNWLNALVYEMAIRKMLFGRFRVCLDGTSLRGQAWGEAIDVDRHDPAVEVKGATCTGLKVAQDDAGHWFAQCIVDV
jgi:tRNA nucleotidyltransferase (CCA-adding enzyme)